MPKILIADDSKAKQMLLKGFLLRAHWQGEVFIAKTTEEAKETIDTHRDIAFALIDYQIPSENGPAIIRYLKEKIPSAHCALVTASDNDTYKAHALAAGAQTCICTTNEEDVVERQMCDLLHSWKGE